MRLINTKNLQIQEFTSDSIPRYAILSHTWGSEEVSFQEMQEGVRPESRAGFCKIKDGCAVAARDGYEFFWVDTCCIDKTSSAELSESINSMFQWYERADVCYAYLADVPRGYGAGMMYFRKSLWFTRGWTLQELIASKTVMFLAADWTCLGSKSSMVNMLTDITGIDEDILMRKASLCDVSVSRRMSWASQRKTTRPEDIAYCLMGIFNVNMPLLYGEGNRAFLRLQEEIMRSTGDQSLFVWRELFPISGLFAAHPRSFNQSRDVFSFTSTDRSLLSPTIIPVQGLSAVLFLLPGQFCNLFGKGFITSRNGSEAKPFQYQELAILDCQITDRFGISPGIRLHTVYGHRGEFTRTDPMEILLVDCTSDSFKSATAKLSRKVTRQGGDPTRDGILGWQSVHFRHRLFDKSEPPMPQELCVYPPQLDWGFVVVDTCGGRWDKHTHFVASVDNQDWFSSNVIFLFSNGNCQFAVRVEVPLFPGSPAGSPGINPFNGPNRDLYCDIIEGQFSSAIQSRAGFGFSGTQRPPLLLSTGFTVTASSKVLEVMGRVINCVQINVDAPLRALPDPTFITLPDIEQANSEKRLRQPNSHLSQSPERVLPLPDFQ